MLIMEGDRINPKTLYVIGFDIIKTGKRRKYIKKGHRQENTIWKRNNITIITNNQNPTQILKINGTTNILATNNFISIGKTLILPNNKNTGGISEFHAREVLKLLAEKPIILEVK